MNRRAVVVVVCVAVLGAVALAVVQPWDGGGGEGSEAAAVTTTTTTAATTTTEPPLAGTPGAAGIGDPYFPGAGNGGYDVEHYTLDLTWAAEEGMLAGVATIDADATQDLSRFNLDLSGLEVQSVTVDGEAATFEHADRELQVTPAEVLGDGDGFRAVIAYRGRPQPVSDGTDLFEVGWHTDGREAFVASEPIGAMTFFPANDHPTDKATYTLRVTAPEDQAVAANGLLVAENDTGHGTRSWTYEARDPMATYLVQIAIGDYDLVDAGEVEGVVIRHAFHRNLSFQARVAAERTGEMLQVLDDLYGPYPFEAYGVLAVDEELGFALETQTLTLLGSDIAEQGREADSILVHELAHQWVGNTVSPATWKDIWLNEGFATYSEWLFAERTGGPSARDTSRRFVGYPVLDLAPGDPGADELFSPTVYYRGAMALQALREQVGDEDFFTILRTWLDDHTDDVASTEDLVALAERVSGEKLDGLFEAWLYDPEQPRF